MWLCSLSLFLVVTHLLLFICEFIWPKLWFLSQQEEMKLPHLLEKKQKNKQTTFLFQPHPPCGWKCLFDLFGRWSCRCGMDVFGSTTCVLNSNQKWHERVLPGGSLLVPGCSSSLGPAAAVCVNFSLNFSSVHKHAELDYAYQRIDLRLTALRNRIIQNSLTQGTQGRLTFPLNWLQKSFDISFHV